MAVSAWTRAKQRLPWLIGLMFGDFLAAGVIENFSAVLETVVALAFFIPVLLDMGGNVGTQSLALTVRGLATGECSRRDVWRMVWRESRVGIMLGTACGTIIGVVAGLWQKQPLLGLVVGLTMFATLSLAAVLGIVVPMIMDKLGVDPAIAASPFITSVADVSGLLIYFMVARFLLIRVV
jgi:magnesium transporter